MILHALDIVTRLPPCAHASGRFVLFADEEVLLLLGLNCAAPVDFCRSKRDFFPAFKGERHGGERDFGMFLNDGITIVSVNKVLPQTIKGEISLPFFQDIFFKLLKFGIIGQRGIWDWNPGRFSD